MTFTACIVCRRRIPSGIGGRCANHARPADRLRRTRAWTELSRAVRSRGICDLCQQHIPPERLEAHHVIPLALAPWRGLDPSNVVAACGPCHGAVSGWRGR